VRNNFVEDFRRMPMKKQGSSDMGSGDMEVAYAWTQIGVAGGCG
jgi:hypothetical protein